LVVIFFGLCHLDHSNQAFQEVNLRAACAGFGNVTHIAIAADILGRVRDQTPRRLSNTAQAGHPNIALGARGRRRCAHDGPRRHGALGHQAVASDSCVLQRLTLPAIALGLAQLRGQLFAGFHGSLDRYVFVLSQSGS
jgi:hypothetical protein